MFDTKNGQLLWRGAMQVEVQIKNEPRDRYDRAERAMKQLLNSFPNASK